jgi:hypothetical protein
MRSICIYHEDADPDIPILKQAKAEYAELELILHHSHWSFKPILQERTRRPPGAVYPSGIGQKNLAYLAPRMFSRRAFKLRNSRPKTDVSGQAGA